MTAHNVASAKREARDAIELALSLGVPAYQLAHDLNELARDRAVTRLRAQIASMREGNVPEEHIADYLITELTYGSDDEWSGRTNDVRRAEADGKRAAIARELRRMSVEVY